MPRPMSTGRSSATRRATGTATVSCPATAHPSRSRGRMSGCSGAAIQLLLVWRAALLSRPLEWRWIRPMLDADADRAGVELRQVSRGWRRSLQISDFRAARRSRDGLRDGLIVCPRALLRFHLGLFLGQELDELPALGLVGWLGEQAAKSLEVLLVNEPVHGRAPHRSPPRRSKAAFAARRPFVELPRRVVANLR